MNPLRGGGVGWWVHLCVGEGLGEARNVELIVPVPSIAHQVHHTVLAKGLERESESECVCVCLCERESE